jgi:plasmid maintenance system antidote protein VapI
MSFELEVSEKELAGAEFVAKVGKALQRALLERKTKGKFTQQELANLLEVDRARVNRCFSGYANLTAESLGELGWALGAVPELVFKFDGEFSNNSVQIIEFHKTERTSLDAIKTLSIGTGTVESHVWVVMENKHKHYSLPINFKDNVNVNSAKVTHEPSGNWKVFNLER